MVDVVTAHTIDPDPYVTFIFKYRPIEMLMAGGIAPRPTDSQAEEIRALENKLKMLRSKAKAAEAPPPPRKKVKTEPGVSEYSFRRKHNGPPEIIDLTDD
ncbi:hypothetical protein H0H87_003777 [Tephrocybe sp. NHM501043]|nr:hypothetical protein H0H87_003777 [Tephrocybe sp. NHM501043]